jgi:hypothetical protein
MEYVSGRLTAVPADKDDRRLTPWRAVQRAAWEALKKQDDSRGRSLP